MLRFIINKPLSHIPLSVEKLGLAEALAELHEAGCVLLLLRVDVDVHASQRPKSRLIAITTNQSCIHGKSHDAILHGDKERACSD